MASRSELVVTLLSARNLHNVNYRHGHCRPVAVAWVDPNRKCFTRVDEEGNISPYWDQTLAISLLPGPIEDQTLHIHVLHYGSEEGTAPVIGSVRLKLRNVLDEAGLCESRRRNLQLKRPSGRPKGEVEVVFKAIVKEPHYGALPCVRRPGRRGYPPPAGACRQHRQNEKKESKFKWIIGALAVGAGVALGAALGFSASICFRPPMDENVNDKDEGTRARRRGRTGFFTLWTSSSTTRTRGFDVSLGLRSQGG